MTASPRSSKHSRHASARRSPIEPRSPEAIEQLFQRMLEIANTGRHRDLPVLALGFLALKFLADAHVAGLDFGQSGPSRRTRASIAPMRAWLDLQRQPDLATHHLKLFAAGVERDFRWAQGLFTQILLHDIDRLEPSTLRWWVDLLASMPLALAEGPRHARLPFVDWFDGKLDEGFPGLGATSPLPRSLARLLVALAEIKPGEAVLDPYVGTGVLLAEVIAATLGKPGAPAGTGGRGRLCGQDPDLTAYACARLRVSLLGRPDAELAAADSLLTPAFTVKGQLARFDVIVGHTPFTAAPRRRGDLSSENGPNDTDSRLSRRSDAPGWLSTDAAFLQHVASSLANHGRAVVLVSRAFLSRGGADARARAALVRENLLEAAIGLPAHIMPSSSGFDPAVLMLQRQPSLPVSGVTFVDASGAGGVGTRQDAAEDAWVASIRAALRQPRTDRPSPLPRRYVMLQEILDRNAVLQPTRYLEVGGTAPASLDAAEARSRLNATDARYRDALRELDALLQRLQ